MDTTYESYGDKHLGRVVEFWNRNFQTKRNFFKIDEEIFKKRVINKVTALEKFDPRGMILALSEQDVIGMIHCGVHSEEFCKICYSDWGGGYQGYITFMYVERSYRKCGVGSKLIEKAYEYFQSVCPPPKKMSEIIIDGQCIAPYYGNSEGPMTPFWGTTEGINIDWDDWDTRRFFKKYGFEPRYKALSLESRADDFVLNDLSGLEKDIESKGFIFKHLKNLFPVLNASILQYIPFPMDYSFNTISVISDEKTKGYIVYYEMKELNQGRFGIYEMTVAHDAQKMGLGRYLLKKALKDITDRKAMFCEVLTVPELSPGAYEMYEKCGFKKVYEWAVY